jgi:hypothetical protein
LNNFFVFHHSYLNYDLGAGASDWIISLFFLPEILITLEASEVSPENFSLSLSGTNFLKCLSFGSLIDSSTFKSSGEI